MRKEKHTRSLLKGITWRIVASLTTMILVFIFTKDLKIVAGIGILDVIVKYSAYYLHERAWNNINWGFN